MAACVVGGFGWTTAALTNTWSDLAQVGPGRAKLSRAKSDFFQKNWFHRRIVGERHRNSHTDTERKRARGLAAQTAVSASCRLQTSLQPHHAQTTWWSRTRAVHPAGGATGQRRSQACWVHPLESRNTEASSIQTMCLFCFVHVQTFRVLSLIFLRYQI